jgi:class 3 adenylate cyclase
MSLGMMGQFDRSDAAYARAEDVARALGSKRLEFDVLRSRQYVVGFQLRLEEAVVMGDRVIALAQELGEPTAEAIAHFFNAGQFWVGRLDEAKRHADACRALVERTRSPYGMASGANAQAQLAITRGEWDEALSAIEWGLQAGRPDERLLAQAATIAHIRGQTEVARGYQQRLAEQALSTPPGPTVEYSQLALVAGIAARLNGGESDVTLQKRAAQVVVASPVPGSALLKLQADVGSALVAHFTKDQKAASELLQAFEAQKTYALPGVPQTDHLRGLLLETLDRLDEAIDAVEAALTWLPSAYRPERAEASYDCARLRLKRGAPGDAERARVLIDESLAEAQALGMKPLVERILALKLEDQGISTSTDIYTSIDQVARAVQSEHPDLRKQAAPDGTVTIMFSDIEGSTEKTDRLGDKAWMEVLREHNAIIREQVKSHGGFEVKSEGDGFMVAFQSAGKALACASAIQKALVERNQSAAEPVRVRMGLHAGEVIKEGEDFFGRNVIMAARVASQANGGEILASSVLKALLSGSDVTWGSSRTVELKGLSGEHEIWAVEWA